MGREDDVAWLTCQSCPGVKLQGLPLPGQSLIFKGFDPPHNTALHSVHFARVYKGGLACQCPYIIQSSINMNCSYFIHVGWNSINLFVGCWYCPGLFQTSFV